MKQIIYIIHKLTKDSPFQNWKPSYCKSDENGEASKYADCQTWEFSFLMRYWVASPSVKERQ